MATLEPGSSPRERIAVHEVCFPPDMDATAILAWAEAHRVANVGFFSLRRDKGWDALVEAVARSSVKVPYLSHAAMFPLDDPSGWGAATDRLAATISAARALGAPLVYGTTGPAGRLDFEGAWDAFVKAVGPMRDFAASQGVRLMIETTSPTFGFTHFVHNFGDTVEVAESAGLDVCFDMHSTWQERGIYRKVRAAAARIALVQVADQVPRNMTVARDVIGDGIAPIEALLATLQDAGYRGVVDIELFGRPAETALADIAASVDRLEAILGRLTVGTAHGR